MRKYFIAGLGSIVVSACSVRQGGAALPSIAAARHVGASERVGAREGAAGGGGRATAEEATNLLGSFVSGKGRPLVNELARKGGCIVVVPYLDGTGFVFGAVTGRGLMACSIGGREWSSPSAVILSGTRRGSIARKSVGAVLFTANGRVISDLKLLDFVVLGACAPLELGRDRRLPECGSAVMGSRAESTESLRVSFDKGKLRIDNAENEKLYGRNIEAKDLLDQPMVGSAPDLLTQFVRVLDSGNAR